MDIKRMIAEGKTTDEILKAVRAEIEAEQTKGTRTKAIVDARNKLVDAFVAYGIALGAIDTLCGGIQIPHFIMRHIRPWYKVINRKIVFRQYIVSIYLFDWFDCKNQLPVFLYLFKLSFLWRIKLICNSWYSWITFL